MSDEPSESLEEFDPVTFELATGNIVKISLGLFWSKLSDSDKGMGIQPYQYLAIRVYGNEDSIPKRIQQLHELRAGKDFGQRHCSKIWQWLLAHVYSRKILDHENTDDFLAHFEDAIDCIVSEDEDMLEHLDRLPGLSFPEYFDRVDDSIFTDQND